MISRYNSIALRINSLQSGTMIANESFEITEEDLVCYLNAIGSSIPLSSSKLNIPSIAIAAWSLGSSMKAISLPEGAVHISHQISSSRSVCVGARMNFLSSIVQNELRRGVRFLKIEIKVTEGDRPIIKQVATITIKESDA